ncbi:MAG: hypothetical protein WA057_03640, partial [Candidatus Magasanikiibacteriota bacterium]
MNPKKLNINDPWMLGEDIPNCDLFFSTLWLRCFVTDFAKHTGLAYDKIMCHYKGYHLWFYFGEKNSYEVAENIVEKIVNEFGYASEINKNIIKQANILRHFSERIPQTNLEKLSKEELWNIYDKHQKIHHEYYTWCWIPVAADMFHNNLTSRVKAYLKSIGVPEKKINEYFIVLTQPTKKSLIFIEQQDLLKIGLIKDEEKRSKLLEKHRQKYYYTKHIWVEGEYTIVDYKKQLAEISQGQESCVEIIKKQDLELKKAAKKKKQLIKELKINKQWQKIFYAFGDFMVTKIYRRYAQILAVHHMSPILREIAKRMCITEKQVRFMLPHEVKAMLLDDDYDEVVLLSRTKECIYYSEQEINRVYIGDKAKEFLTKISKTDYMDMKELRGEIGCPGLAKG